MTSFKRLEIQHMIVINKRNFNDEEYIIVINSCFEPQATVGESEYIEAIDYKINYVQNAAKYCTYLQAVKNEKNSLNVASCNDLICKSLVVCKRDWKYRRYS